MRTSRALVLFGVLMACANAASAQDGVTLSPVADLDSDELEEVMTFGLITHFDSVAIRTGSVFVRFYVLPIEGGCVPETHYICTHRVYAAVTEGGEAAGYEVFRLGEIGDLTGVRWVDRGPNGAGIFRMDVARYPAEAVAANPNLRQESRCFLSEIDTEYVRLRPCPDASS